MKKIIIPVIFVLLLSFLLIQRSDFTIANQEIKVESVDLFRPLSKDKINELNLESNNFLSVFIKDGKEIILSEKKADEVIAIASLTKLMTAIIVLENYNLDDLIQISASAIATYGDAGNLQIGEIMTIRDLLYITLIESSNDGAEALAEKMGVSTFVYKMNEKATSLGMNNTWFINPSGLDEENLYNFSTVNDLKKMVVYILENHSLIAEILSLPEKELTSHSGISRTIRNTNVLLEESDAYLWGKTGYTNRANGCLILILNNFSINNNQGYVINIIAGADDKFGEARKLEQWLKESFIW
ncbi:MAG TPA: serine hydrolase [Candidatus Pacearchaeota archaeon]|nr:serine hydrolase [Candidatus Pacearchaeota archaeon]HOS12518.1 serine hydrolase [Candidatus Pacearchaeota archaeon]HPL72543.1 serine hydrolase [Candidatus Pacearchaeota archaeon]